MKNGSRQMNGFTLVEILLVVVIIAALSAMVIPRMVGRGDQARMAATKADIDSNISTALKMFELDNGFFPSTAQGLSALRTKPNTPPVPPSWNGPYLEKEPIDQWGNPYVYTSPGVHRPDYDLSSKGKDQSSDSDDIKNWE